MSQPTSELENQLNEAIENCQFELAQSIKDQIDKEKQEQVENDINQIVNSYKELIEDCHGNLIDEINHLNHSNLNQEMLIRQKASSLFHELQVRHIEVLMEIEKRSLFTSIIEKYRIVSGVSETLEKAKLAAKDKKYELAQKIKDSAIKTEQETLNQRQETITKDFYARRDVVFQKQKDEMKSLTQQLDQALCYLRKKKEREIDNIYQRYQKLHLNNLQEIIKMIKVMIHPKDSMKCVQLCKKEYTTALNQYFRRNTGDPVQNNTNLSKTNLTSPTKKSRSQSRLSSNQATNAMIGPADDQLPSTLNSPKTGATPSPKTINVTDQNTKLSKTPKKS